MLAFFLAVFFLKVLRGGDIDPFWPQALASAILVFFIIVGFFKAVVLSFLPLSS